MKKTGLKHHSQPGELFSYSYPDEYTAATYPLSTYYMSPTLYAVSYQAFSCNYLVIHLDDLLHLTFLKGTGRYSVTVAKHLFHRDHVHFGSTVKLTSTFSFIYIWSLNPGFDPPFFICIFYLKGGADCFLLLLLQIKEDKVGI